MKHNPKLEEKKAAGIDDDFAVKKICTKLHTAAHCSCCSVSVDSFLLHNHSIKASVTCCFVPACSSAAYSPALLCVQLFRRFES